MTTAFFADNYHSGYIQETGSQHWNELDAQARKSIRNKFTTVKRAVKMVLLHADSYPETKDKDEIRGIAIPAEKRLREALKFDGEKPLSMYRLEKELKRSNSLEKACELPDNTPDEMRKFFLNN